LLGSGPSLEVHSSEKGTCEKKAQSFSDAQPALKKHLILGHFFYWTCATRALEGQSEAENVHPDTESSPGTLSTVTVASCGVAVFPPQLVHSVTVITRSALRVPVFIIPFAFITYKGGIVASQPDEVVPLTEFVVDFALAHVCEAEKLTVAEAEEVPWASSKRRFSPKSAEKPIVAEPPPLISVIDVDVVVCVVVEV